MNKRLKAIAALAGFQTRLRRGDALRTLDLEEAALAGFQTRLRRQKVVSGMTCQSRRPRWISNETEAVN